MTFHDFFMTFHDFLEQYYCTYFTLFYVSYTPHVCEFCESNYFLAETKPNTGGVSSKRARS